ncbi:MAG: glyoxalase [Cyanobacteria bacterium QS_8_64_29]|nr:MAG: glyoxalase [Cyanobacteria bacterium QS_8_64_29]
MATRFKHVMLMVADVPAALAFYRDGLGLPVKQSSANWAELEADGTTLALHAADEPRVGSSPILSFQVDDIQTAVAGLEQQGAQLEGRIREPPFGKVAAMRSPDGHLLSLLQPAPAGASTQSPQ